MWEYIFTRGICVCAHLAQPHYVQEVCAEMRIIMKKCIYKPNDELSKYAPKTEIFKINPAKIKDVIGRGGEMITKIIC